MNYFSLGHLSLLSSAGQEGQGSFRKDTARSANRELSSCHTLAGALNSSVVSKQEYELTSRSTCLAEL